MRAEAIQALSPQLTADVSLYSTAEGGKKLTPIPGWGCLCCRSKSDYIKGEDGVSRLFGYTGWPQLKEPLALGDRRRLGFVFLAGQEAADALRKAGTFFLWEGRFIGEAIVVS